MHHLAPQSGIWRAWGAGVDISKPRLDMFNLDSAEMLEFENNPVEIKKFLKYEKESKPTPITA